MEIAGRIIFVLPLAMMAMQHFMNMKAMTDYAASKKVPMAQFTVIVSGLAMIAGLLGLVFNYQTKVAGWIVVAFLLGAAMFMHNFWAIDDENMKMVEMTQFLKNMGLAGGAIAIMYLM